MHIARENLTTANYNWNASSQRSSKLKGKMPTHKGNPVRIIRQLGRNSKSGKSEMTYFKLKKKKTAKKRLAYLEKLSFKVEEG